MISNLNLDIEILHIEIDLNMLFLIFIEYESVNQALSMILKDYQIHSITADNGTEYRI